MKGSHYRDYPSFLQFSLEVKSIGTLEENMLRGCGVQVAVRAFGVYVQPYLTEVSIGEDSSIGENSKESLNLIGCVSFPYFIEDS